ncbi:MAG: ROK family protein [Planctomycetota bacterium]|nr:MAG: ROK family protein [Planctomycetota bacterium]
MTAPVLAGLDLGGTKIGVCLGDETGKVIAAARLATQAEASPEPQLRYCIQQFREMEAKTSLAAPAALGIAAPGPLDPQKGCLLEVPNMPAWQGFPLRDFLADHLACPVNMANDANASVLAEAYWGAAQDVDNAVFLTMSTGMGAGLLLDRRVYEGQLCMAGEIGHIRLSEDGPVGFGKAGSVEGYLSGPGMVQVALAEALACRQRGEKTEIPKDASRWRTEDFLALARKGDPAALRALDRIGAKLGQLAALLADLLNPDVLILGTIGSAHLDLFEPRLRRVLDQEALPQTAAHLQIRPSGLSDRGNQTALALARQQLWYE